MRSPTIRTSQPDWLGEALRAYRGRQRFRFEDDAGVGFEPEDFETGVEFLAAASRHGTPWPLIAIALAGIGIGAVGIWLVRLAILDPEPTSKLAILLAGGVVMIVSGGFTLLWALGVKFRVQASGSSFVIEPLD